MQGRFLTLFASLLVLAGCSKSNSTADNSVPTATPVATASATVSTPAPTISPSPTSPPLADAGAQLRDLEKRMDAIFADTFRGMSTWFDQSTRANSIDLREQNGNYIARLYIPRGDNSKVDAKVENGVLHITAQNEGGKNGNTETEHYEHYVTLAKPVLADKLTVEKKDDVVVVSVPKSAPSAPTAAAPAPVPGTGISPSGSPTDWAGTMLAQMNQMRTRLNQTIRDVFQNDMAMGASTSQLGSAMNIEEQNDRYIVHFYLPDKNLSDVNVTFENNQVHLTAQEQKKSDAAAGDMQSMTVTRYETMTTLPGPVKNAEMKVERKEGSVIVTLPKAN